MYSKYQISKYFYFRPSKNGKDELYVVDYFETTPPMSTFTFGFVISQLEKFMPKYTQQIVEPNITIWATSDLYFELEV